MDTSAADTPAKPIPVKAEKAKTPAKAEKAEKAKTPAKAEKAEKAKTPAKAEKAEKEVSFSFLIRFQKAVLCMKFCPQFPMAVLRTALFLAFQFLVDVIIFQNFWKTDGCPDFFKNFGYLHIF